MDEGEGDNPSFPEIRGFPVRFGIFFCVERNWGSDNEDMRDHPFIEDGAPQL
jgi:hypothetical protein